MALEFSAEQAQFALKVVVSIIVLLCGYFLGRFVEKVSVDAIERFGLKRRVKFGIEREMRKLGFSADIIRLLGTIIKYFVYFSALLIVVDYLQIGVVKFVVEGVWLFLPRAVAAITIIVVGSVFIEFAVDLVKFNLRDLGIDHFADEAKIPKTSNVVAKLLKFFLYLILAIMALSSLGVELPLVNALITSLGISAIIAIVLLLTISVKDVLPDITNGIYIRNSLLLREGDKMILGNVRGKVIRVGLVMTEIKSSHGVEFVPNSSILKKPFTKVS